MRTRVISGAVLLAGVAVIAAVRGPLLWAALLAAVALGAREFYDMAAVGGHRPWRAGGIALALALTLPALAVAAHDWIEALPAPALPAQLWLVSLSAQPGLLETTTVVLVGIALLATLLWRGRQAAATDDPLAAWTDTGLTLGGALYIGGILKYGLLLNRPPGEIWWFLLIILCTAAADSGAYFAGRAWGRRKLIPHISPNKTWAGFWGGLVACVAAVALFAGPMHLPAWHVPLLGAAIGLSSVAGDLCESMLKRSFGVKDSSHLIPGHGGLLDRLDSILFVLLVVYGYMQLAG
jgi:phosphatidate cytidylyltransferase